MLIMRYLLAAVTGLAIVLAYGSAIASDRGWKGGGFVAVSPKYEGSDEYQVFGLPYVLPDFGSVGSMVDIRGADDVRFKLFNGDRFTAGPLAGYRFDREEDDGDLLGGLGDVDGGLVVGAFAGFKILPPLMLVVSYHRTVTGDVDGGQLRFGVDYEQQVSPRLTLIARAGASYADDEFMQSYFGVTDAQATNSTAGLTAFDADAGIKDVHIGLGSVIQMSDRWSVRLYGQYSRLVGDAADSPVIETEDQFSGSLGVLYKFGSPF